MAELPQWEREYRRLPGELPIVRVILVFAIIALLFIFWPTTPAATQGGQTGSFSFQSPACAEAARLRSHGATSSPSYARVRAACARSSR